MKALQLGNGVVGSDSMTVARRVALGKIFGFGGAMAILTIASGCASVQNLETNESPEKRIQRKFGGMPLVFGSKSNAIPSDIVVIASGEKNGDYILKLPFLEKVTEQEFRVNLNGDITSPVIKITIASFDPIATAIANRLNLKEGEQYKVTLEGGTIYIRLLYSNKSVASADGKAL